jgi:hypothetical protein
MSKHLHKASSFEQPNLLRPRPSVAARKRKSCGRVFARSKSHQSFRSVSFSIVVQRKIDWITRVEFFRNPPLALPFLDFDRNDKSEAAAAVYDRRSLAYGAHRAPLQFNPANPSPPESGGIGDHPVKTRATIRRLVRVSTTPDRPAAQSDNGKVVPECNGAG